MSKIAILGYGVEGKAVEAHLKAQGINPVILDEKNDPQAFEDLSNYELVYRSPGVPLHKLSHPNMSSATKLFFELCPCPIIGVTGTKGKGTTSTLIYKMLKKAGKDVYLGGNIGTPALEFLDKLTPESWVILELSSFQLEDLKVSPHIAVVLMVTSEHLDVHASTEAYRQAKYPILKYQTPEDLAFINGDYPGSCEFTSLGKGLKKLYHAGLPPIPKKKLGLRGPHNLENVKPAVLVARHLGVGEAEIEEVLYNFKGLPHRLEQVKEVDGVQYFNDSFSSTPETSIAAIRAFTEPLYLIAGGSDKGADFTEWGQACAEAKNLKKVLLIGLTAPKLAAVLPESLYENCETLQRALARAQELAQSGDCVVLSPACASFDQFDNYKDRGEQFRKLVRGS